MQSSSCRRCAMSTTIRRSRAFAAAHAAKKFMTYIQKRMCLLTLVFRISSGTDDLYLYL